MKDLFSENLSNHPVTIITNKNLPESMSADSIFLDIMTGTDFNPITITFIYEIKDHLVDLGLLLCLETGESYIKHISCHEDFFNKSDMDNGILSLKWNEWQKIDIYFHILCERDDIVSPNLMSKYKEYILN